MSTPWDSVYPIVAAFPHMAEAGYGRVVATVSTAGLFGQPRSSYYAASRSALVGFIRSAGLDIVHGAREFGSSFEAGRSMNPEIYPNA